MKPLTVTDQEWKLLEDYWKDDRFYWQGEEKAEAKMFKAFKRLFTKAKGKMIRLEDAKQIVSVDFIELFNRNRWIKQWKEAPPYMIVFQVEPQNLGTKRQRREQGLTTY